MSEKIRVGIVGYGNLGKGTERAVKNSPDFELVTIFDKRSETQLEEMQKFVGKIDIMLLCIGSSVDLPIKTPQILKMFNTVDSYDTHAKIPEYFAAADEVAKQSDKIALVATGWDPGLLSVMRALMEGVIPTGKDNTFWGHGVSQGHGEAIKRVPGVLIARSYTTPIDATLSEVKAGQQKDYSPRQMHTRDCYVVAKPGEDLERIRQQIVTMPNYFEPYDTKVTFIDMATFEKEHGALPHGGFVSRAGTPEGSTNKQMMEFSVKMESNPEFTAASMLCYSRATWRMYKEGRRGAITVFDVPVGYLTYRDQKELARTIL